MFLQVGVRRADGSIGGVRTCS